MNRTATLDQIESFHITNALLDVAIGEICQAKASVSMALSELDNVECPSDPEQYRTILKESLRIAFDAIGSAKASAELTIIFAAQAKV